KHRKRQEQVPFHQHVRPRKTVHRHGLRFENPHDLGEHRRVVVDMLHHLIAEAKLKVTVGEWDAIIRFVYRMQSSSDTGPRDVAFVPIIVAIPPIDDVDAMNVVTHIQQYVDRLAVAAAKIEHARARLQRLPEPFKKAQVCADRLAPLVANHYGFLCSKTRLGCGAIDWVCSSPAETLWPVKARI